MKINQMKISKWFAMVTMLILVLTTACKKHRTSIEEQRLSDLAKTWILADGVAVTKGGTDVTAEYSGFALTLTIGKTYATDNGAPIWKPNGSFVFGGTTAPNINQLIRDDGIVITITSTNEQITAGQLVLQFEYITPTGRVSSPDGGYVMNLKAR